MRPLVTSCICKQAPLKHNSHSRVKSTEVTAVQKKSAEEDEGALVTSTSVVLVTSLLYLFYFLTISLYFQTVDMKMKGILKSNHFTFSCETLMCRSRKIIMTPLWAADVTCIWSIIYNQMVYVNLCL